ncbi:hypothetical protein PIB30_033191, partial [Stylosanthes scabra]|nr:hypothetical protein [Stylosanthes scabra]
SKFQSQYEEHALEEMHKLAGDATGSFTAGSVGQLSVVAKAAVTHRPPPELPDLYSIAVREGVTTAEMVIALAMSRAPEDLKELEIGVCSGTCAFEGDDGARTSTEVGASAKENVRRIAEYGEAQHRSGRTA